MILLTGSTGKIGKELVQYLMARKREFRVMVRSREAEKAFDGMGIRTVHGDFERSGSYLDALNGIKQVFLLTNPQPDQVRIEGDFLKACRNRGVQHVVRVSAIGANPWAASALIRCHGRCEAQLEDSGLPWTILRPNMFMQNLAAFMGPTVAKESTLYAPAGEARMAWVDTRDIAAVAGTLLTTQGPPNRIYEITGPQSLTFTEVADHLSTALGRHIAFVNVPDGAALQAMLGMGMSSWLAEGMITLYHLFKANGATALALDTVERITGQPPRTLEAYIQENQGAFRPKVQVRASSPPSRD